MEEREKMVCKGGGAIMPDREMHLGTIRDHLVRYAFATDFVGDRIVLDVACGSGYGSSHLLENGAGTVIGGDMSVEAITAARQLYGKTGAEFLLLDATRLPFTDNSFDVIVSLETIEHLEQYRDYLNECRRVLKEGGILICSTPNKGHGIPELIPFGPDHVHEFYLDEFREVLSEFFREIRLYAQGHWSEAEKKKIRTTLKLAKVMKPVNRFAPKLYELIRFFYRKIIDRAPYLEVSEIGNWDKILDETYKPIPITDNLVIPKTIIAVARK